MKNKFLIAIAVAAVLTLGGLAIVRVNAAETGKRVGARGPVLQRIASELQLTEDQIGRIKTELAADKDTIVALLKRLHEARKGLRETIQSGADEAAVRASFAKVSEVESDLAVQRSKLHAKIGPILTDEQIAK